MSNWTEVKISVNSKDVDKAGDIASMVVPYGIYIEDYSELEKEAWEIAHIDLIDEDLLKKDRNKAIVHVYISPEENPMEAVAFLRERYTAENIDSEIMLNECRNEDWENNWKQYFKPFGVGENIVIKPTWENYDKKDGQTIIEIDPASSFGSGSHMTTRLCLECIERLILQGKNSETLLDMGCGSGILGIGAYLLAGSDITAVYIEENSIRIAKENAEINSLPNDKFHPYVGNVITDKELYDIVCSKSYNIIAANIVSDIIIMMAPMFKKGLAKAGRLIVSGIISVRANEGEGVLVKYGFKREAFFDKEGWAAIVLTLGE